jgi:hypothetical protein
VAYPGQDEGIDMFMTGSGVCENANTHVKYNVCTQLFDERVIVWGRYGGNLVPREVGELDCILTYRCCILMFKWSPEHEVWKQ